MYYDFKAARQHREELVTLYRILNHTQPQDGTWDWWIKDQIEEIDREIAEAYESRNAKMTTVASSGHPVISFENTLSPIVPHWATDDKENRYESYWNCT